MMNNVKTVGACFNISYDNPKYNNYLKNNFVVVLEYLCNGEWITKRVQFKSLDLIDSSFYAQESSPIEAIRIKNLLYNNQPIPTADWSCESLSVQTKSVIGSVSVDVFDSNYKLYNLVHNVRKNKYDDIWINDIPDSVGEILLFNFYIEMKNTYKTFILRSNNIDPSDIEIKIEKLIQENGKYKLKTGELVSSIKNLDIESVEKEYIYTATVSANDSDKREWYVYFKLQDDININDTIVATLIYDKRFLAKEDYKILYPHHTKAYFYIDATYKKSKVFIYDGRLHSLINPTTNTFYDNEYIYGIVKNGFGIYPLSLDVEVFTSTKKLQGTTDNFISEMTEETANTFQFIRVKDDWKNLFKYETAIVKGSNSYAVNYIEFDKDGNMFIPLVSIEWLLVKNVCFVDDDSNFIRKGELRVYNEQGSPVVFVNLNAISYVPFVVKTTNIIPYLFSVDGKEKKISIQESKKIKINPNDIVSAEMLLMEGYEYLYLPGKYQKINIDSTVSDSFDSTYTPDETILDGWWPTGVKRETLLSTLWYDSYYNSFQHIEKRYESTVAATIETPLPNYFEIEVRHIIDNSLVLNSVIELKTITREIGNDGLFATKDSDKKIETTNGKTKRLLTYGSTGKILIPQALNESILVSLDEDWIVERNLIIKKGSAVLNRYTSKVILYVSNKYNGIGTGFGEDYLTDTALYMSEVDANYKRIEVRDAYTKELVWDSVISVNGADVTLYDGFVNCVGNKISGTNIPVNSVSSIKLNETWLSSENYIDMTPESFRTRDTISNVGSLFVGEKNYTTKKEPNAIYRKTILWVYRVPDKQTDMTIKPSSFRLIMSLADFTKNVASKSFTPYKYQGLIPELNVTTFLKTIPLIETEINNLMFKLNIYEYGMGLSGAFVTDISEEYNSTITKEKISTTSLKLRNTFVTYKSSNQIKENRERVDVLISFNIPSNSNLYSLIDLSSGTIEKSIATNMAANPDDVDLHFYDRIEFKQNTLNAFVVVEEIEKNKPLYGRLFRKLEFTGNVIVTDETLIATNTFAELILNRNTIKERIYEQRSMMALTSLYDKCFSVSVRSDCVEIKWPDDAGYEAINQWITSNSLQDIYYYVLKGVSVENDKSYIVTDVQFKTKGNQRLDSNYLKPLFFTEMDGSEIIRGYTTEKMIFSTVEDISGYINKSDGLKTIVSNLSDTFKLKSRLMGTEYIGNDGFKWSVRNIKNDLNDAFFNVVVDNDCLTVSTEVSVQTYSGIFKIPVTLTDGVEKGILMKKEFLVNYKPKDIFGNIYDKEDYENISYVIVNEDTRTKYTWENTNKNISKGLNDILYQVLEVKDVLYTTNRNFSGFIPDDKDFRIFEIDWELLRPKTEDNIPYDLSRSLEHLNFKISNNEKYWTVIWIDTLKTEHEGSISILITRKKSLAEEIINVIMRPKQRLALKVRESFVVGTVPLLESEQEIIGDYILRLLMKVR